MFLMSSAKVISTPREVTEKQLVVYLHLQLSNTAHGFSPKEIHGAVHFVQGTEYHHLLRSTRWK